MHIFRTIASDLRHFSYSPYENSGILPLTIQSGGFERSSLRPHPLPAILEVDLYTHMVYIIHCDTSGFVK